MRYEDSPQIKGLIAQRKRSIDPAEREVLVQEIAQQRKHDKAEHKLGLLQQARQGNRAAIAHIRRSSSAQQLESSYVARKGGARAAAQELQAFYEAKYAREDDPPTDVQVDQLGLDVPPPKPITRQDMLDALQNVQDRVSSGQDGVTYEALRTVLLQDDKDRLPQYLTRIMTGSIPVPALWRIGKICLLPKTAQPEGPGDLRPICLTPCLCRLYGKILMRRLHEVAPPYQAGQLGSRKGMQTLDGITTAQSMIAVARHVHKRPICLAKLDIRAAFDSVSHRAILTWLLRCRPCAEASAMWKLCADNTVRMGLGSEAWDVPMGKGIMQGTSFSADLFSRVIDMALGPLEDLFRTRWPKWAGVIALPHFLLYADDILVAGATPEELQHKVQCIADSLATIGLHVNLRKCKVLNLPDGTTPGVWLRGQAAPLQGETHVVFLGVPLSHSPDASAVLSYVLKKSTTTFFAFKRLFEAADTRLDTKLDLFETYVASRWLWCAPALWPSVRMLKHLEGVRASLVLSMLRLPTDPFMPWVDYEISRRRAAKIVCEKQQRETWSTLLLRRYWGHKARAVLDTPCSRLFRSCMTLRISCGFLKPAYLVDAAQRKLQHVYLGIKTRNMVGSWETAAQNRQLWDSLEEHWVRHWNGHVQHPTHPEYLMNKQLVLLDRVAAFLRPSRQATETPYGTGVVHVKPYVPPQTATVLWASQQKGSISVVVAQHQSQPQRQILVQQRVKPDSPSILVKIQGWKFIAQVFMCLCEEETHVVIPRHFWDGNIFQERVDAEVQPSLQELLGLWDATCLLQRCHLKPLKTPRFAEPWDNVPPQVFPPLTNTLIRCMNGENAQFFSDDKWVETGRGGGGRTAHCH